MATIAGQEAKAESTRMAKQMIQMMDRMEMMEGRMAAVKGPDAETQALTSRLKRDMEAVLAKSEVVEGANKALAEQLATVTSDNDVLRREIIELRLRLTAAEEGSNVSFPSPMQAHTTCSVRSRQAEAVLRAPCDSTI